MSTASVASGSTRPANGASASSRVDRARFGVLPREAGAHVNRPDRLPIAPFEREQHRAVETAREQHRRHTMTRSPDVYVTVTEVMYLVTKRIDFCYGHRLLDYDGICKHPHGHNAVVEVDVRTDRLDERNMVADFSDIKRIVKGWIDRELDHKMILRHDDPLVEPLEQLGEPIFKLDSNPTVERIAKLIFDMSRHQGLDVVSRARLGDADVVRGLFGIGRGPEAKRPRAAARLTGP